MFDPFRDFETAGYLRNRYAEKDLSIVKATEHALFRANLPDAADYLAKQRRLNYQHFLQAHRILFQALYPWAGEDRAQTAPDSAINKGGTLFSHPRDAERAVSEGLRLGQDARKMRAFPGEVMGLFAYGHPFLDCNGRTMLLVHAELCERAGFSIGWQHTSKNDYLTALTEEIRSPGRGILDRYLLRFIDSAPVGRKWTTEIAMLPGLDGASVQDEIGGSVSDPAVAARYEQFERHRGYQIKE